MTDKLVYKVVQEEFNDMFTLMTKVLPEIQSEPYETVDLSSVNNPSAWGVLEFMSTLNNRYKFVFSDSFNKLVLLFEHNTNFCCSNCKAWTDNPNHRCEYCGVEF